MAENKGTTRQDFPEVRGKIVDNVELSSSVEFYGITICFQDRTTLTFTVESGVVVFPAYSDWEGGNEKPLKQYQPVQSKILES